jgi:hypothetical protein
MFVVKIRKHQALATSPVSTGESPGLFTTLFSLAIGQ